MTVAVTKSSFTQELSDHILNKTNIEECKKINVYAVKPPLVPEKPFTLEVAKRAGYFNYPPTGSLYLCSSIDSLKLKNVECDVIDLNNLLLKYANEENNFTYDLWKKPLKGLNKKSTQLVFLVSYMFGTQKECYVNTANFIRSEYPDALIITGGVQATFDNEEILKSGLTDLMCLKEGELQIRFIIKILHDKLKDEYNKTKYKNIFDEFPPGGIRFISNKRSSFDSGPTTQPTDLELDLSKYYKKIDIANYYKYGNLSAFSNLIESYTGKKQPSCAIQTKRGCRANCAFCTVRSFNGQGLRKRNTESVLNELRFLYSEGIRHIEWLDDDLLWDQSFNLELFNTIKEEFPDLIHTASNGLIGVAITPKLMEAMSESGLIAFKIGVESGSSQVIKDIRKPTTLWKLLDKAVLIRKYPHIFFSANFIIGFPGETFSQMMDTFTFARKLAADWSSLYVCQPLKGTDMYSSFQHLMDPRTLDESYNKLLFPGKTSATGEFGKEQDQKQPESIQAGWKIFELNKELTFDNHTHNEIWFTFNLVTNYLANPCYQSVDRTKKLLHWLYAIHCGFTFDVTITAALAHAYYIVEDKINSCKYRQLSEKLILESKYWQMRVTAFPELMTLAKFEDDSAIPKLLKIKPPKDLVPNHITSILNKIAERREANQWRD